MTITHQLQQHSAAFTGKSILFLLESILTFNIENQYGIFRSTFLVCVTRTWKVTACGRAALLVGVSAMTCSAGLPRDAKLKGVYHEHVTNLRYAAVSLTMVCRERYLVPSERLGTFPLVTSRIWRDGRAVTTYQFSALSS